MQNPGSTLDHLATKTVKASWLLHKLNYSRWTKYSNPATRTMLNPRTPKSQCFSACVTKSDVRGLISLSSIGASALQVTLTLNFGGDGVVADRRGLNISSIYGSTLSCTYPEWQNNTNMPQKHPSLVVQIPCIEVSLFCQKSPTQRRLLPFPSPEINGPSYCIHICPVNGSPPAKLPGFCFYHRVHGCKEQ
jgi:hypothetical protein